jgi:putative transposase
MLVLEFKTYGEPNQFNSIDEGISVVQFIRNKSIRIWMDGNAKSWIELSRHCAILANEVDFAYTDSNGIAIENPHFLHESEEVLKRSHRRQRKDHTIKLARCVIKSNDLVTYEDLRIKNIVKNHCLAKSINDASWYQFRMFLEYFGKVFGKAAIAVNPQYTDTVGYTGAFEFNSSNT